LTVTYIKDLLLADVLPRK